MLKFVDLTVAHNRDMSWLGWSYPMRRHGTLINFPPLRSLIYAKNRVHPFVPADGIGCDLRFLEDLCVY